MSERIIIENFLGLKNIDMEVRDINILIGPQATGKSVIAKLLYYFKDSMFEFSNPENTSKLESVFNIILIDKFFKYFPNKFLGASEFKIRYEIDKAYIEIKRNNENKQLVDIYYSDDFSDLRTEFQKELNERKDHHVELQQDWFTIQTKNIEKAKQKLGTLSAFKQLFIPAGRSFYSIVQKNIFTLVSNNDTLDPFLTNFGSFYERMKKSIFIETPNYKKEPLKEIEKLMNQLLSGTYVREKDEDYINLNDGRRISIANASSGQQEILPLNIVLSAFIKIDRLYKYTIYIEEPEAHLFPTSQKHIVELIASTYNISTKLPLQFFITTHSPYILTSLNNLIQAGILQKKFLSENPEKLEALYKIVPKEQMIDPEKVAAYTLENGKLISLLDKKYQIMNADSIDDVSDELGVTFDSLVDMEYK
jgi:predicted ATPase